MGFTIGSGGGPPPDNSVSEDKIVDEAVSEAKLSAAVVAQLGGGAEWQTATQGSNGSSLEIALSPTGDAFEIFAVIVSNSANSLVSVELNQSAGSYTYYVQYNGVSDSGAGSYISPGLSGSGSTQIIRGTLAKNGTTAILEHSNVLTGIGVAQGTAYKTISGLSAITHFKISSNQANGIGAGSFIKARKIA